MSAEEELQDKGYQNLVIFLTDVGGLVSAEWDSDVLNRLRRILHGKKHEFTRSLLLKPSSCRTV